VSYVLTPSVKLNAVVVTLVAGRFAGRAFATVKNPEMKLEVVHGFEKPGGALVVVNGLPWYSYVTVALDGATHSSRGKPITSMRILVLPYLLSHERDNGVKSAGAFHPPIDAVRTMGA